MPGATGGDGGGGAGPVPAHPDHEPLLAVLHASVAFSSHTLGALQLHGDAVVNVVYADVLEVGEARRSTQVGQIEKSMDRSIRVDKIDRRADREE